MFFGPTPPPSAKEAVYSIHFSSKEWQVKKDKRSDYVFQHKQDGRILLSNSYCGEFQDGDLKNLAEKTFRTVDAFTLLKGNYESLGNREAFRAEGSGLVDGVQVVLRVLNTRRNSCYIDFVSISPLEHAKFPDKDFDAFLSSAEFP